MRTRPERPVGLSSKVLIPKKIFDIKAGVTFLRKSTIETLKREFPESGFLSEETHTSPSAKEYVWIIDPLDGTNNYVFGIPFYCVSIALTRGKDILLGVIYDPVHEELFLAEKGKGCFNNGRAASVSNIAALSDGVLGMDIGYHYERSSELLGIANILRESTHCMRVLGSSALALAYIACGRTTAYLHRFIYPWDIAAGLLMIEEAGGRITDWGNNSATFYSDQIVATNGRVHKELMALLKERFQKAL